MGRKVVSNNSNSKDSSKTDGNTRIGGSTGKAHTDKKNGSAKASGQKPESGKAGARISRPAGHEKAIRLSGLIAGIWMTIVLAVFPLYLHDGYYDVISAKYAAFVGTCGVMAIVLLLVNLGRLRSFLGGERGSDKAHGSGKAQSSSKAQGIDNAQSTDKDHGSGGFHGIKNLWKSLSTTDRAVLIFFIISVISTLQASPYISQAFYGNEGRYNGLILNTAYTAFYFLMSRNLNYKPRYIYMFAVSGFLVCAIGITDFFHMDVLNLRGIDTFMSTIGNINFFTTFCGLVMAVAGGLFIFSQHHSTLKRIAMLAAYAVCLEAMLMGNSDNTYLCLGAVLALTPFVAFRKKDTTCRYMAALSTFFTCVLVLLLIDKFYQGDHIKIDSVLNFVNLTVIAGITIAMWIATFVTCHVTGRLGNGAGSGAAAAVGDGGVAADADDMPKALVRSWVVFIGICLIAVIGILIWANVNSEMVIKKWPKLAGYLVFNDDWGTYRGYIWKASLEEYACLAPIHQIFGTGPDTFGIYVVTLRYYDMVYKTGFFYDSVHNEYLELLFTLGPIGLAAHLTMLYGTVKRCIGAMSRGICKYKGTLAAIAMAVTGYAAQAVININVPMVALYLWALIAVGESILRSTEDHG